MPLKIYFSDIIIIIHHTKPHVPCFRGLSQPSTLKAAQISRSYPTSFYISHKNKLNTNTINLLIICHCPSVLFQISTAFRYRQWGLRKYERAICNRSRINDFHERTKCITNYFWRYIHVYTDGHCDTMSQFLNR
jgi:hypothetical protein